MFLSFAWNSINQQKPLRGFLLLFILYYALALFLTYQTNATRPLEEVGSREGVGRVAEMIIRVLLWGLCEFYLKTKFAFIFFANEKSFNFFGLCLNKSKPFSSCLGTRCQWTWFDSSIYIK